MAKPYTARVKSDSRLIVVALGGNAISPPKAEGNLDQQFDSARTSAARLADLIAAGYQPVITHGNGPQVGNVLRRVELAAHELYTLTLDICVADTQSGIGYMLAQCLMNELRQRGQERIVSTIVTTVEIDPADPAFGNPSKPIGRFYEADRAEEMRTRYGWQMIEDAGRGWRRVVPSPLPRNIVEIETIWRLVSQGELIVAAGGGGIPVSRGPNGELAGVEAIIDKDRTAALLAARLHAEILVIATEVERVALNFGKPDEKRLDQLTVSEARRHRAEGQFPAGSMGPKIESAIYFLMQSGRPDARVVICDLKQIADAVAGKAGTTIVRG